MKWLRTDAVLAIHKRQIAEHGGIAVVRDIGLVGSALSRPQNIAAYKPDTDAVRLAAAYGFGIVRNHPFIDGTKRTALIVTRTFLLLNGFQLNASQREKYRTIIALANGTLSEAELENWLRDKITPNLS